MDQEIDTDQKEEFKQLLMMLMIHLDAVTRLLVEKGLITKEELFETIRQVERDYRQKGVFRD